MNKAPVRCTECDCEQLRAENARLRETTEKLITALDKIEQQADYGQVDACQRIASAALSAYPAPVSNGPDWEGFGRALMENWPTGDIEGSELFDLSHKYRLIVEAPGGYDTEEGE